MGLAGTLLVAGAAPAYSRAPRMWRFSLLPRPSVRVGPLSGIAFGAGLALVCVAWYLLVRAARRRPALDHRIFFVVFVLWCAPLLVGPPLLSHDVYSYAAQGEMAVRGLNPTTAGPDALPPGPYRRIVDPVWRRAPAPYGPISVGALALSARITGGSPAATVEVLRLVAFLGVLAAALLLARLADACGTRRAPVLALGILNPIMVLHVVGGAHNEALVLPFLAAGVLLSVRGRRVWGVVLTAAAAAVKAPAAVAVAVEGWHWPAKGASAFARLRTTVGAGLLGVVVLGVLTAGVGFGWGWVSALKTSDQVWSSLAPAAVLGLSTGYLARLAIPGLHIATTIALWRGVGILGALSGTALVLRRADDLGEVRSIGLSLVVFAVFGPVLHSWYLMPGLMLLAVSPGALEPAIVVVSIAGCLTAWPTGDGVLSGLHMWRPFVGVPFLAVTTAAAVWATRRQRTLTGSVTPDGRADRRPGYGRRPDDGGQGVGDGPQGYPDPPTAAGPGGGRRGRCS